MIFRGRFVRSSQNNEIAEKIKKDLLSTFKKRGISVTELEVGAKYGKLNISVCIKGKD